MTTYRPPTDDGWDYDELTVIAPLPPSVRPTAEIPRDRLEQLRRACTPLRVHPRMVKR